MEDLAGAVFAALDDFKLSETVGKTQDNSNHNMDNRQRPNKREHIRHDSLGPRNNRNAPGKQGYGGRSNHSSHPQSGGDDRRFYENTQGRQDHRKKHYDMNQAGPSSRRSNDVPNLPLQPDFLKRNPMLKGFKDDVKNPKNNEKNCDSKEIGKNEKKSSKNVQRCILGYRRLEELAKQDPLQVTIELANSYNGFQYLLDEEHFLREKPDWIVLISSLLEKVCSCEFPENKIKVLTYLCESKFIDLIVDYLSNLSSDSEIHQKHIKAVNLFLCDVIKIFETLTNIFPNNAKERFHEPVRKIFGHVSTIEVFTGVKVDDAVKNQVTNLAHRLVNMGSIAKTMNDKKDKYLDEGTPPEDFRSIELYPQEEELLQDKKVFLRRSIVDGGYTSVEHYLDVQFRLLRQDLVSPLRDGFKELIDSLITGQNNKQRKRINNLRLFKNSSFERIETKNDKAVYILCFDVDRKIKTNWEYSRWFMFGSIVYFSFDNFNSFFMGTVFEKNIKTFEKERVIAVELIGDKELQVEEFGINVMMVESTIFFQPYFHVMKALKQFDESNFPMSEYIVRVNPVIKPPAYLKNNSYLQIAEFPEFDVLDELAWPTSDKLGLDQYQYDAYKGALTREFVIIQGPPGTGKTYLGLRVIETFLRNEHITDQLGAPILLVCYTNHALDQFLEGILRFTTSVVRVGSQTKSEIIKPYELAEKRKCFRFTQGLNSAYITMREEIKNILTHIKTLEAALNNTHTPGIVNLIFLRPYMSPSHQKQLNSSSDILQWLLVRNVWDEPQDVIIKDNEEPESDEDEAKEDDAGEDEVEDYFEEDEVRNQLRNEESLLADFDIKKSYEEKMTLHILTTRSIENQLIRLEREAVLLERQANIQDRRTYVSMRNTLESKQKQSFEGAKIIESQFNRLKKTFKIKDCTNVNTNILKMNLKERWNLYWSWLTNFRAEMMTTMRDSEANLRLVSDQYSEAKQLQDLQVLMNHKILGITTTAAAKNHLMLASLKPKIVVVEEAAEVFEAHIVTALTNHCEHLILIGDHQQLRPNPSVFELAKKYNLEISLFERMIKNKLTFSTLGVQHRMRPDISDLITPVIYPNLQNHSSVYNYPDVRGVTKNLFFVTHENVELTDDNIQSYQNPHEGDFVLRLARYLLFQGYSPDQITILTTYSGQMIYLKMKKKRMPELKDIRISTVDNYQGEECEIILLSLVRSNPENKIGFLSTPNRVCVALSRAKHGFYLIGNMTSLEEGGSAIWPNIRKQLEMHKGVGPALELQCLVHRNITPVAKESDFMAVTEGGCSKMCNEPLVCGHSCKSLCHPNDREHKVYKCPDPCTKKCNLDHPCQNRCYEVCSPCRVMITRELSCGHVKKLPCYIDADSYLCLVSVKCDIELCGHEVKVPCNVARSDKAIRCSIPCKTRLLCGHACTRLCHVDDDPDHLDFKCFKPCEKKNALCSLREPNVEEPELCKPKAEHVNTRSHYCKKPCHEQCSPCNVLVTKQLLCLHSQSVLCHLDVEFIACKERCNNILPCNHACGKRCVDPCGDCNVIVEKKIVDCNHIMNIECRLYPERKHCRGQCERTLLCGHQCSKKCCEPCDDNQCEVLVELKTINSQCGHPTKVPCKDRNKSSEELLNIALERCPEPCTDTLLCEHICQGSCSGCRQGRLHVMCKEKCGRVKICEHSCKVDCAALCPPCKEPCPTKCVHSKCPHPCGQKCPPCLERCQWRCDHFVCKKTCREMCCRPRCYNPCKKKLPCKHNCIGYCGEPCPPKCRICDKEEVTFIMFGFEEEEEEDTRFVVLEDCGHFFESRGIETFLKITSQPEDQGKDVEIALPKCPQCKTPVINTLRFMNKTRQILGDIAQVKKKQNGRKKNILQMKMEVTKRLKDLEIYPPKQEEKRKFLNSSKYFSSILRNISRQVKDTRQIQSRGKRVTIVNRQTRTEMILYTFILEYLENVKTRVLSIDTLSKDMSGLLLRLLDEILAYVVSIPQDRLSGQQSLDLQNELARFYTLADLLEIKNSYHQFVNFHNTSELLDIYKNCMDEIICLNKFDKGRQGEVDVMLKKLELEADRGIPQGVTPEERRQVHLAMMKDFFSADKQGHWFKCGNKACEEMYCITECGGAMEMAKCPSCKSTIGGAQHRYIAGTRLASEMDGATAPAWPSGLH